MATPRKGWFKVADSVGAETWSNDEAATFLRLCAHLNTRWARDGLTAAEACRTTLRWTALCSLTGSGSLARARSIIDRLAIDVSLTVIRQGTDTVLVWPKFAIFQGYASRELPESRPPIAPSADADAEEDAESKKPPYVSPRTAPKKPAPVGAAPPKVKSKGKTPAPDDLTNPEKRALLDWVRAPASRRGLDRPDLAQPAKLRALVSACLDHHRAKGNVHADWVATCRTWIRNEADGRFAPARPQASTSVGSVPRDPPPCPREPGVDYEVERQKIADLIAETKGVMRQ